MAIPLPTPFGSLYYKWEKEKEEEEKQYPIEFRRMAWFEKTEKED